MKTKTLPANDRRKSIISECPNFSSTGSISGMKKLYYGKDAMLIRCGKWIYNCTTGKARELYLQLR
jgi:hypothetical protein